MADWSPQYPLHAGCMLVAQPAEVQYTGWPHSHADSITFNSLYQLNAAVVVQLCAGAGAKTKLQDNTQALSASEQAALAH